MSVIKYKVEEKDVFFLTFIIIFSVFLAFRVGVSASADDISYLTALDHRGYVEYFAKRYATWSGRVTIEFLAVSIMPHQFILKILMVFCYILFSYSIWKISLSSRMDFQYGIPAVLLLALMINPSVSAEAVYWAAGAFNYLVPVSLGLFSVCVLLNQDEFSSVSKSLSLIGISVSSNSEQCAIILILISFLNLITRNRNSLSKYSLIYYTLNLIFSLLIFLSPGAHQRFIIESGKFMPNFGDFTFFQKASFGIDRYVSGVFDHSELLFLISSIALLILTIKESGWMHRALRASFFIFLACKYIVPDEILLQPLSPVNWSSIFKYLYYVSVVGHLSLMLICIIDSDISTEIKSKCAFCIIMGSAITVAIGLSPTVYASGERILYFSEVFLIIFICNLIPELKCKGG